jgi:hypothetical protein
MAARTCQARGTTHTYCTFNAPTRSSWFTSRLIGPHHSPGVGLGITATGATRVTDDMFLAAADALSESVTDSDLASDCLFPPLELIRDVSRCVLKL